MNYKEIELRSEEVQEVMNQVPPWILRCGIFLLFIIVMTLLAGSWFFKYPDVIKSEIIVTSVEPPVSIVSRSEGKIDAIYVRNNQHVVQETPLAVIQNPANTQDMLMLIKTMRTWELSGYSESQMAKLLSRKYLSLGAVQSAYATFLNCLNDYQSHKTMNYYPRKIASQQQQLIVQKEYYRRIIKQVPVAREQLVTSQSVFERDSMLLSKDLISVNEYDLSKSNLLQKKQTYLSFNASLKQSEQELMKFEENLLDLLQQASELEQKYKLSLQNATEALKVEIKAWERDFLLVSPIDGVVTQMGVWSRNQNVKVGETVFSVIPNQQNNPKGKAMLPVQGAGKVKRGQRVNVRVNNFPDQEFGYLVGQVESISSIPTAEGFYVVEISFPKGMETNYGKTLPITQQMMGSADIITKDLRLGERLFMPLKRIIKNQQEYE